MNRILRIALASFLLAAAPLLAGGNGPKSGCQPIYMPPGVETGDFATGIWVSDGDAFLGGERYHVSAIFIDNGGSYLGQPGNTLRGTEQGIYDFGNGDTFVTFVSYTAVRQNDPTRWALTATERIVSGTGRFASATGMMADHGTFGLDDPDGTTGWALFEIRGAICNVEP